MRFDQAQRVLITGGAGFLGSHLCDRYLYAGWDVLCLDNFLTGNKANIDQHFGKKNFELIRHDITHAFLAEVDLILNFACPASPRHYQSNPIKTLKTSLFGAMNMLGMAKRVGAKMLHASTSEVYGTPEVHPQTEDYWGYVNPVGKRSCYDEGKRAAETLCYDYAQVHKVDVRIARIFNTYGPRMALNDGRVITNFILQALKNEPITIFGKGDQTRSFCYVDDLIEGIIKLSTTSSPYQIFNLGNAQEVSILELAQLILTLTNSSSKLLFQSLPCDDPHRRKPDLTRATTYLNYTSPTSLEDGLKKTILYFEEKLKKVR